MISSRETIHGFQDQEDIVFSAVPATLTVHEWRAAILSALPTTGQNGGEPECATMYLSVFHLRALHPDTSIVIGAHGMGKSFRPAVPVSDTRRVLLENTLSDLAGIVVRVGFSSIEHPGHHPGADVLTPLPDQGKDSCDVWGPMMYGVPSFRAGWQKKTGATLPCHEWEDTITWLKSQPETAARLMQPSRPQPRHWRGLVVFDALDRITPA